MPDDSPPVSSAAPTATSAPVRESPVMSLCRQALGPLGVERNIRVFSVFEATGRTRPGWNWFAAFLTLHWMVFYRLWRPAALYAFFAACLLGLFLAVDATTMPTLASLRWWLLLAFALLGTLLPGLYGDALLYAQTELRVHNAITESQNLEQARALLARRAGTGRRIAWQALAHLLLLVLGGTAVLVSMAPSKQPQRSSHQPEPTMATPIVPLKAATTAAITPTPAAPTPAPAPLATLPPTAPIGGAAPVTTPQPTAPTAETTATAAAAAKAVPQAPVPPPPPVAKTVTRPPETLPLPEQAPATTNTANKAIAEPVARQPGKVAVKPAPEPVAPPVPRAKVYSSQDASQPHPSAIPQRPAPVAEPARPPVPGKIPAKQAVLAQPAREAPPDKGTGRIFIHAGTFSVPSNAEKVHSRIEMAGLPATLQNFTNADKNLIRVRVGPFSSHAEANRAAAKLRSMHLDAMIYGR